MITPPSPIHEALLEVFILIMLVCAVRYWVGELCKDWREGNEKEDK